jgi:hypothetical protein
MIRTWLPVEGAIVQHRKTRHLARLWHCHPYTVVGFLVSLWHYCLEFQSDGRLSDVPSEDLRDLAAPCLANAIGHIPGVLEALTEVGFADGDGRIHDWQDYAGQVVVRRERDRERKRAFRKMSAGRPSDVSRTSAPTAQHSTGTATAAAARPRDVKPEPAASPAPVAPTYAQQCTITANNALDVLTAGGYKPLTASVEAPTAEAWQRDGVPLPVAVAAITDAVRRYRVTPTSKQPRSLKYFDLAVREAHEKGRTHRIKPVTDQPPPRELSTEEKLAEMDARAAVRITKPGNLAGTIQRLAPQKAVA